MLLGVGLGVGDTFGESVGDFVGGSVGDLVGGSVGESVGDLVGAFVGEVPEGLAEIVKVGDSDGLSEIMALSDGLADIVTVGVSDGKAEVVTEGTADGLSEIRDGRSDGKADGMVEGESVGDAVGPVGAAVGEVVGADRDNDVACKNLSNLASSSAEISNSVGGSGASNSTNTERFLVGDSLSTPSTLTASFEDSSNTIARLFILSFCLFYGFRTATYNLITSTSLI